MSDQTIWDDPNDLDILHPDDEEVRHMTDQTTVSPGTRMVLGYLLDEVDETRGRTPERTAISLLIHDRVVRGLFNDREADEVRALLDSEVARRIDATDSLADSMSLTDALRTRAGLTTAAQIAGWRAYADSLRATGSAYITAAGAAGMDRNAGRREAADYLTGEGQRLIREARNWDEMADLRSAR